MTAVTFWTSTVGLFKTVEILRVLVYVSAGIFCSEIVHSAQFDWSLLSGKRQYRWTHLLYFGAKLSYLAFLIQIITAFWLNTEVDCQAYLYAWEFLMGLTVITSSSLLACRTIAVNNNNNLRVLVKFIVIVAILGLVVAWMQGVKDVTAVWAVAAASPWNSGACLWTAIKETYYVKYVVTIIFDIIILALTVVGIVKMNSSSRFGTLLVQQGIFYVVLTVLVNLTITVLTILQLSPTMSLIAAIPQSTICVIASTRLYSQLAQEASKRTVTSKKEISNNSSSSSSSTMLNSTTSSFGTKGFLPSPSPRKSSFTDLEKGLPINVLERKVSLDDVMEIQSRKKINSHQIQHSSSSSPPPRPPPRAIPFEQHPFSNMTVLQYHNPQSTRPLPLIIQETSREDLFEDASEGQHFGAKTFPSPPRR